MARRPRTPVNSPEPGEVSRHRKDWPVGNVNSRRSSVDGVPKRVHPDSTAAAAVEGIIEAAAMGREDESDRRGKRDWLNFGVVCGVQNVCNACLGAMKVLVSAEYRVEEGVLILIIHKDWGSDGVLD
jgi:hypothetical protein